MKKFKLGSSDLESILPIEVIRNPRGPYPIKKYNEADVRALALKLSAGGLNTPSVTPSTSPSKSTDTETSSDLAPRNGSNITRTRAIKEFKVSYS